MGLGIWWDILLLFIFLIFAFFVVDTYRNKYDDSTGFTKILTLTVTILLLFLIINNYTWTEAIEGTVSAISKEDADEKVTTEFSNTSSISVESTNSILKAYEVAIHTTGKKKFIILKNQNNLWRFKFNKRELQLQIMAGKTYKFRVQRFLFFGRNILDIEEK